MKPAIDTSRRYFPDPYQKTVCCLRCEQKLDRYQLMRVSPVPGRDTAMRFFLPEVRTRGVCLGVEPAAAVAGNGLGWIRATAIR